MHRAFCSSSLIFLTFFFRKIPVWTIQYILDHYELFWSGPNCFGWVQIILVRLKLDLSALISKFVPSKIIFQIQIYRFKPRKRSRLHLTIRLSRHILSLPVPLHPTKKNWTRPKWLVLDQNDLDSPKSFWTHRRTRHHCPYIYTVLSGGQRHRIAIARCLYSKASCTILDMPFSALDSNLGNAL